MPKASTPSSLTIRMYNVGFGDCFLLTFHYWSSNLHVLIDFGSTSAPKTGAQGDYMLRIAEDIKKQCGGKLRAVVATHRHRDHISGFAEDQKPGQIIASLKPEFVIQPWTEDPRAPKKAMTATSSKYKKGTPVANLTAHFLGSLEDMHRVAASVKAFAGDKTLAGPQLREQLEFIGDDNLKNAKAVKNLMKMGKAGTAYFVNAGMTLNILPGVKCTVFGPPDLEQSNAIRKQRARDPGEFWQFRSFWAAQGSSLPKHLVATRQTRGASRPASKTPPSVRWFLRQARQIHADQMLELVRDLDSVMNNTSVILLFEVGNRKILFPGDAQIENWAYALANPAWVRLLKDVNVYKVGHHGSLNATPKSLWKLFRHKGKPNKRGRLESLCSTKSGKHGSTSAGTEVPRRILVDELKKQSTLSNTEDFQKDMSRQFTVKF
jgi:beta-lactamase superfamily II metal-dependent hydrolase